MLDVPTQGRGECAFTSGTVAAQDGRLPPSSQRKLGKGAKCWYGQEPAQEKKVLSNFNSPLKTF